MMKTCLAALTTVCLVTSAASAQDVTTVLASASKAMGADAVRSVTLYGSGAVYQASPSSSSQSSSAKATLADYRRTIDFAEWSCRTTASSVNELITRADLSWNQQMELWLTPWGFLQGAAANNATVRTQTIGGERVFVVSWNRSEPNGRSRQLIGYINAKSHYLNGVETWIDGPTGDVRVQALYGSWRDGADGFKFPAVVVQQRAGKRTFEAEITSAEANPPNLRTLMAVAAAPAS